MSGERYDVMVVGTGFGGSVTAARLAEGGMRVLMLERGPWWGPAGEQLAGDPSVRRRWPRGPAGSRKLIRNVRVTRGRIARELELHADGLFELHKFERLLSLTGSGVGGGSLVYTNIQAEPEAEFFAAFPPELSASELAPYFQRVRAMLRPAPLPQRPDKNRAFERAVEEAHRDAPVYPDLAVVWGADPARPQRVVNAAGVTQSSCVHCGECILGCPHLAKTTLDLTYVPTALRAGAELRALAEVVAIGELPRARGGGYELRYVDRRDARKREHTVRAGKLVLAAGTLNTLRLLFAARDRHRTLERLPMALGHGFSPNADLGSLFVGARAHLHDSTRGPAFNAYLPVFGSGLGSGLGSDAGSGRAAHRYLVGEVGLPLSALPLPRTLARLLGTSGLLIAMGADASTGTVGFDGEFLRTDVGRELDPGIYGAIEADSAEIAAAYRPKWAWINAPGGRGKGQIATVHPLGGAAIGRHAGDGVVDHRGQVFDHPGLYVADGSLYPRAPGIPPSMTIAALAERQASLMLAG